MQFRNMALESPLLSTIRNAVEWLADPNDNVTLLLLPTSNVFNGDTECYGSLVTHRTRPFVLSYSSISLFSRKHIT